MRRGHPRISGWRGENPRQFRPRPGGGPPFRPPRGYGMLETPRFPPPGPRPFQYTPFNSHLSNQPTPVNEHNSEHERHQYHSYNRHNPQHRPPDRQQYGQRQNFPLLQRMRHGDVPDHGNQYEETPNYYDDKNKQSHTNMSDDRDHRQNTGPQNRDFKQRQSSWINPKFLEDRNYKPYRHHDGAEVNKGPVQDYTGHRPPASDHYGGNLGSTIDNSNTFSRSIDDTVNIVRKRLMRRESQHSTEMPPDDQGTNENKVMESTCSDSNVQEQPKKKTQRQRQNVKLNCDKIKNKIVDQLFKMDKDKICKLMDHPNSSTKFEYAISSLVTESQNSFNRHLRSVAEQSLCSSSTDFIHNDNNTIYEDTFMKQMQCLLDPQDTILLEDIKPMVLAELSKVLQLDDFEHRQEINESSFAIRDDQANYNQYNYEDYPNFDTYSPEGDSAYYEQNPNQYDYGKSEMEAPSSENTQRSIQRSSQEQFDKPLFERRRSRKSPDYSEDRRSSSENRRKENSFENMSVGSSEPFNKSGTPIPLFGTEQFSDDDDPFAELDRQYHVAVDHNFLGSDDIGISPKQPSTSQIPIVKQEESSNYNTREKRSFQNRTHYIATPDKSFQIKQEIDSQLQNFVQSPDKSFQMKQEIDSQLENLAQSPLKLSSFCIEVNKDITKLCQDVESEMKQSSKSIPQNTSDLSTNQQTKQSESEQKMLDKSSARHERKPEPKVLVEDIKGYLGSKFSAPSRSRKRSTDQRPSHRKEKRKKSESGQSEANKQILNKNIIINVNDCAAKSSETCEAPKSIFNLFFSKEKTDHEAPKEAKVDTVSKNYSEKYVKRKETPRKSKDRESDAKKKHDSVSSSHSTVSPDNSLVNLNNQNPSKLDPKIKLKPIDIGDKPEKSTGRRREIDIFEDQMKKASSTHQAHRNTAPVPSATPKTKIEKNKSSLIQVSKKITRRHIATQVVRKSVTKETQTLESKITASRFCQTERKKSVTRGSQTTPVFIRSDTLKSCDTFERMKEIDMEIQVLLQEKFKLYSSLESKESYQNTMQSLGMAVLNVTPSETENTNEDPPLDSLDGDAIVESFTNIPVEELEQIALESADIEDDQSLDTVKHNQHPKVEKQARNSSASPSSTTSTRKKRKSKTSYITLIEQIITDERPLEDIISLDELEDPPPNQKKKSKKAPPKKKQKKKGKVTKPSMVSQMVKSMEYDLKECYVLLQRQDLSRYLRPKIKESDKAFVNREPENIKKTEIIEELVVNDLQFDMLDVSEDIVIGDSCEIKLGDKNTNERGGMMISEEIILDNSQSSLDDTVVDVVPSDIECKTFDFLADEHLSRDSITVTGNGDAVLAIECIDNNFIAACVDGNVYHFSGDGQLLNTLRGSNLAVTCLTIVKDKYETTVYTGSLDSRIRYYDLNTGVEKGPECNVLSPIQTMDRAWDTVFVGTKTGFVLQFECKNNMLIPVSTVKFSDQSILALRAMKEGPRKVLLVGARSEGVTIKDAQTGLLLRSLEGPKMTIYSLLFEDGKVYCGTSTHQIHVYDYASGSHVNVHEGGKGAVCLRAAGGLLFAGCYDGCVYVYIEGEPRPRAQLRGPPHMLLSLAIHGSKLIAGYNDRSLYIWKIPHSILQEIIL